ncbi:MAG TPA: alanine racemase [Ktedonobacteraceae bacterium]|jgi:alanine racemase|nr:alanine racemase [Ktedonobacteraceae bacterium]
MIFLEHLLKATHGKQPYPGKHQHFDAFNHDSRQLIPGELFVAVRGERGDGHDFVFDAAQRGATGLLVEARYFDTLTDKQRKRLKETGIATVIVEDTREALQEYASYILQLWRPAVIAVTGSVGKTSTKEAIVAVLSGTYATFKSWQNYNDLLGMPLSLGRLEERHEYAVLELSCDRPGEIEELCRIARPQLGVLTNISPAQLQYFGNLEGLAEELGKLLAALPGYGAGFINEDDEATGALLRKFERTAPLQAPIIPFSPKSAQDVEVTWEGTAFTIPVEPGSSECIRLASHLLGRQHVATMLAAYTVGRYCGVPVEAIGQALANVWPMPGRMRLLEGIEGARLLDDTHNAAPASTMAGLAVLKNLPAGQRIAVLGDMMRLGEFEEEAHIRAGEQAARCADYLIVRGERARLAAESARKAGMPEEAVILTSTHEDAAQAVQRILEQAGTDTRDVVYVKGSEEARMERVTERLMARPERARSVLVRQTPGWKQIVVMRPERPTWVEIDLSAIASNTRRIAQIVGPRVRILASLKADAYGHGALKVAPTVLHNGASMLGVATVSEATPLREAGIRAPILVFGYVPAWQMREAIRLEVTITLYSSEAAQALSRAACSLGKTARVHVKVDTGMGRLGVRAEQVAEVVRLVEQIHSLPGLELEGMFTHFAMADSSDLTHARMQLERFQTVLDAVGKKGLRPPLIHAANSAALLSLPEARFDMVRPGIALYGLNPSEEVRLPEGFRPAMSFKTQVSQVKVIPAGECISYGCTYYTERPTTVAVLPVGYADGFRRGPTNWGYVLVHEQEAPVIGRVCMDQCMIDVTHIPGVRVGDEVVLIGRQGSAILTAEQVARRLGTIHYEVVSEILARVPRVD